MALSLAAEQPQSAPAAAKPAWSSLKYRSIGPWRGGRVTAVSGVPGQPNTFYFGATGGGVWKSTDAGDTWIPVSDAFFKTGSVGSIAVADSNPNVVYAGMGEGCIRGNVSHGDGVYRSTDAGKTWTRAGLDNTRHIPRIRIHPRDPNTAWAAVLGHIFGPHDDRGVYKTTDGGKTWRKLLFKSNRAGAIDLVLDPSNPDILYAALWDVKRTPYSLESGGPASGLFKSTDGGETWTDISASQGLPKGPLGRIGIAVSPVNPERVWAQIEAADGGLYRSDDAGKTWRRVNENRNLRQRAWYYTHIFADTQNADRVYALNVQFWRSDDGGATFKTLGTPHGDNHDLWIDPKDNSRLIGGDDGGAHVSTNSGAKWTEQDQATAQFYRVALDTDFPYNIYGAQQDNSTIRIASRTTTSGITEKDWWDVGGGESGWIAPHPKNSGITFAGSYGGYLTRYEKQTGQLRAVNVWPDNPMGYGAEGMKYRFQWNFPILFSPHDPNVLYTGGNRLFKSTNEGQSWEPISPDLTRNDPSRLGPSGGPITKDNTGVEYYCTIFTVAESLLAKGLIWTGSDDGLVYVTRDGGKSWTNVTPSKSDLPEWIQVNSIEASPHDPAKAYFAATMYKSDDFRPYLFRTTDGGKSWKKIVNGIPDGAFTRVIREDPNARGILYAGTETGMYVSFDDGDSWQSLQLNLPIVPITDLAVHKGMKELVVATQGRSFWILDDMTVLHNWQAAGDTFFPVKDAWRMPGGRFRGQPGAAIGENPPSGVVLNVWLKDKPSGEATLEIVDQSGKVIRKYSSKREAAPPGEADAEPEGGRRRGGPSPRLDLKQGLNTLAWDLRHEDAKSFPGLIMWAGSVTGPRAAPGRYTARLTAGEKKLEASFEVKADPRLTSVTLDDLKKQEALLLQIRDKLTETHEAILKIRDIRKQLDEWAGRDKSLEAQAKELGKRLTAVEEELYQTKNRSGQDPLNYPIKLNNKLAALAGVAGSADSRPTDQSYQLHEELTSKINAQLRTLEGLLKTDLAAFNKLVRDKNIPAIRDSLTRP
ncbi:MAG: glycosyl hydrolase [Acidobacteria bacterium]|nr:glycosyl hydrolase [Acidobacteriota bacterium]